MKVLFDQSGINFLMKVGPQFFSSLRTSGTDISVLREDVDPSTTADLIISRVVPLGQRFYPSESAFPLRAYNLIPEAA